MKRRTFIKGMFGTGIATSTALCKTPLSLSTANADHIGDGSSTPTLVVIFQRGGSDGLNTVVPYGDSNYPNLRPTIGIAAPDATNPLSAIPVNDASRGHDNFFGLHPSMQSLLPIYNAGNMAILPTVQYPSSSHSHFDGQFFIESGVANRQSDGWLNRHLAETSSTSGLQAVHFGSSLSQALRGNILVQSFSSINAFNLGLDTMSETNLINSVLPVYNTVPSPASDYQRLVHRFGQILFNNLDTINNIDTDNYTPANGAVYPSGSFGRQLRETAQLIKENVGLEAVTVDIGGWDTHSGQGGGEPDGAQARRLATLSNGIAALYTDLGNLMDNVIILTMTEFGRTAYENGSGGTDHGDAASWFVIGRNIQGGIHGTWPGLADNQLANGRYLQFTVDYRDVLGDILLGHLGHTSNSLNTLLPNHNYQSLGLFA